MAKRLTGLILVVLCVGIANVATTDEIVTQKSDRSSKQPWEWTLAEHEEARRDPARRMERVRAYESEMRVAGRSNIRTPADVIDGNKNPELFFCTELFEDLVRSAFVSFPSVFPQVVWQRSSDLFKEGAEWDRFASIVSDYAEALRQERAAAQALDQAAVTQIQAQKWEEEAKALQEARRTFGKSRFDRMLYETIPPGLGKVIGSDTDFETSFGQILKREERSQLKERFQ